MRRAALWSRAVSKGGLARKAPCMQEAQRVQEGVGRVRGERAQRGRREGSVCAACARRVRGVCAPAHRAWREAEEATERAEGRIDIGSGGAEAREAAVEWRGEDLEAHAEGRAQLLERGCGAGRLHATAALIAALQREQG